MSKTSKGSIHSDRQYRDRWARFITALSNGRSDSIANLERHSVLTTGQAVGFAPVNALDQRWTLTDAPAVCGAA